LEEFNNGAAFTPVHDVLDDDARVMNECMVSVEARRIVDGATVTFFIRQQDFPQSFCLLCTDRRICLLLSPVQTAYRS